MDMDESVIESFYVAGGIGSGINMRNAVRIGMFPNVPLELFHYIGNSSSQAHIPWPCPTRPTTASSRSPAT